MSEYAKILNVPGRVLNMPNLVANTSFCYKRKAKKEALEHLKHVIKISPNRGHIFQNKL